MMSKYNTRLGDIGMLEHIEDKITPEHFENQLYTSAATKEQFNRIKVPTGIVAIREYTSGSKDVNKSLWNHKTDGGEINEHLLSQIHDIHKGLDAGKAPSDDMTVYSGLRRDPQKMTKESGGLLHHPAFISASINPSNALGFAIPKNSNPDKTLHVLKIKVRKRRKTKTKILKAKRRKKKARMKTKKTPLRRRKRVQNK